MLGKGTKKPDAKSGTENHRICTKTKKIKIFHYGIQLNLLQIFIRNIRFSSLFSQGASTSKTINTSTARLDNYIYDQKLQYKAIILMIFGLLLLSFGFASEPLPLINAISGKNLNLKGNPLTVKRGSLVARSRPKIGMALNHKDFKIYLGENELGKDDRFPESLKEGVTLSVVCLDTEASTSDIIREEAQAMLFGLSCKLKALNLEPLRRRQ